MPAINNLNDKAIQKGLKDAIASGKPKKLGDGGGLHLETRPTGSAWWRFRYVFDGREGMLSLGTYPQVPLKEARRRRDEARQLVAAGINPSQQRKDTKARKRSEFEATRLASAGLPTPGTFEFVARQWLAEQHAPKVSPGHADRTRIRFEQDGFPWIGTRPIAEIDPPELLTVLKRVTSRGAIETAHRLKDACGQVFRFAIACGICSRNPAADLRDALPPVQTRHHAAIVEPEQAADLLRAIAVYKGHPVTRAALTLSALLLLRPGELRQLEWSWVDFDQEVLTVPGTLMKRTRTGKAGPAHLVPLAKQAIEILRELHPLTGLSRYIFPGLITRERPMSENTVNTAIRRMGFDRETATAHGFRAMARTMAAERLGIPPEVIEAQLAHSVPDSLGRAYNRTQFLAQRKDLMQRWADYVDQLRDADRRSNA